MSDLFSQPFEDDRETPAVRERRVVTVSELTGSIRGLLESSFGDLWVEGEISNCRLWNTGHLYFTLKDGGAQIKAVMYRSAVRYLKFKAEDGLHVIARGRLGVYEPKGEYQLLCDHLQPHGLGERQLAFEQLKKKLLAEGLFDAARKRALPALPARIGIVTSLDGAALRDIIKVLTRRHPNVRVVIRPTRVQGEGAAAEIADAVRAIGRVPGVGVVIVGRGGGSAEDLWPFNQEPVARAIVACPVPVVTAVGHEIDITIADFVADVRAPTPSAAAEMVMAAHEELGAQARSADAPATGGARRRPRSPPHPLACPRQPARTGGIPCPRRHARPPRSGTHSPTARRDGRRADPARARVSRSTTSPRGARRRPAPGSNPGPSRRCKRPVARRDRPPARSRGCPRQRGHRPAGVAQPARCARARLCRLLDRRSLRHRSERVRRPAGGTRPRDAAPRRTVVCRGNARRARTKQPRIGQPA